jgi:hypothetical protein
VIIVEKVNMMSNKGYRFTIGLAFIWMVLLPFLWAYRLSVEFGLTAALAFLAYRPELVAVAPCAILLAGAWQKKSWAIPGLGVGALCLPLLKVALGGAPTDAWVIGAFLFICLALRLHFLLKSDRVI